MFPKNKEFWRENSGGKLISMDDLTGRRCIVASARILSVLIERQQRRRDEKSVDRALDICERTALGSTSLNNQSLMAAMLSTHHMTSGTSCEFWLVPD